MCEDTLLASSRAAWEVHVPKKKPWGSRKNEQESFAVGQGGKQSSPATEGLPLPKELGRGIARRPSGGAPTGSEGHAHTRTTCAPLPGRLIHEANYLPCGPIAGTRGKSGRRLVGTKTAPWSPEQPIGSTAGPLSRGMLPGFARRGVEQPPHRWLPCRSCIIKSSLCEAVTLSIHARVGGTRT